MLRLYMVYLALAVILNAFLLPVSAPGLQAGYAMIALGVLLVTAVCVAGVKVIASRGGR